MNNTVKFTVIIAGLLVAAALLMSLVLSLIGVSDAKDTAAEPSLTPPVEDTVPTTEEPNATPTITPYIDYTPIVPSRQPVNPTAAPTIAPTPTPTAKPTTAPTPTPTVTPVPTPTPDPAGLALGSGSLRSDTGVPINVVAAWSAETVDNTRAKITVSVSLQSYSLFATSSAKALTITVNGQNYTADVAALQIDSTEEVTTPIGTHSFTVDAPKGSSTTVPVEVTWRFGGSYSGVTLETVTASGEVTLVR